MAKLERPVRRDFVEVAVHLPDAGEVPCAVDPPGYGQRHRPLLRRHVIQQRHVPEHGGGERVVVAMVQVERIARFQHEAVPVPGESQDVREGEGVQIRSSRHLVEELTLPRGPEVVPGPPPGELVVGGSAGPRVIGPGTELAERDLQSHGLRDGSAPPPARLRRTHQHIRVLVPEGAHTLQIVPRPGLDPPASDPHLPDPPAERERPVHGSLL
ncbi:hypothetical protein, partial [Streptomyces tendae]